MERVGQGEAGQPEGRRTTSVIALFEDPLDLREALEALRKQSDAASVSIVIRDQLTSDESAAKRHGAVARSAEAADIGRAATWLTRLASVIVPERGGFLVAGPIGLTLTGLENAGDGAGDESTSALAAALRGFGFNDDETDYIEHRLLAGAMLAATTSDDDDTCAAVHALFAEGNAIYLASGAATEATIDALSAMHATVPPIMAAGDVVVTDAVGHLHGICGLRETNGGLIELCGREVLDRDGAEIGVIDDVLVEAIDGPGATTDGLTARYVIVSFGGVLGLGRKRAAVPAGQIERDGDAVRLSVDRGTLDNAPAWDARAPFSRREEHLVCAYFGTPPYWDDNPA